MRLLVTGTEGYLGNLLAPVLMDAGHDVLGVDTGFYREGSLYRPGYATARTLDLDIRDIEAHHLEGIDAIVHMAELSNDPVGQLSPTITHEINHQGSVKLAETAKAAGVTRFVYTSSCSVYGIATGDNINESTEPNPQTAYAECKVLVERDVGAMADDNFSPTFLRNATAYGASPRMRFDVVLNNLSGVAYTTNKIAMLSDGSPWRPLVHGLDIAKAIRCAVEAPREAVHGEIFNVGNTDHNYQVREIAEFVAEAFPNAELSFGDADADNRSYKVNFDKIASSLPGFSTDWDAPKGAQQLATLFSQIDLTSEIYEHRAFTRLKMLQHLLGTSQIDESFYWQY
jgi:nucleoside-diphosphate-sugar epimerase